MTLREKENKKNKSEANKKQIVTKLKYFYKTIFLNKSDKKHMRRSEKGMFNTDKCDIK